MIFPLVTRTTLALLVATQAPAEPTSSIPAAQLHNDRGVKALLAHDLDRAILELQQAYAALPDPVMHRSERDLVLGSLRSAHLERYQTSGDRVDLCAAYELQRAHVETLRHALGPTAGPDAVAGPQRRLDELAAKVAEDLPDAPCEAPTTAEPVVSPQPATTPARATPPPLHPPHERAPRGTRHRVAAGVLFGVAGLAAVGAASAAGVYADRFRRLDAMDRWLMDPSQREHGEQWTHEARLARTSAIVMGVGSGLLLVAGFAVLASKPRRPTRMSVAPSLTPMSWGLHLRGRF